MSRIQQMLKKKLALCILSLFLSIALGVFALPISSAHAATLTASSSHQATVAQHLTVPEKAAASTCGYVSAYVYGFSGSITVNLYINGTDPYVTSSNTYGSWYGSTQSGSFSGYGSSSQYISFQAEAGYISIYGSTYWFLSDGTYCSYFWSNYAYT